MAEARSLGKLRTSLDDLEMAFQGSGGEGAWYLDLESGEVVLATDESRRELEEALEAADHGVADEEAAVEEVLAGYDAADRQKEMMLAAYRVERGFGERYIAVPQGAPRDGYRDMEDFIDTVRSGRLQERLLDAIRGKGAFRRFKDVLAGHPDERERWFAFEHARVRERIVAWLAEEGIEPIFVPLAPSADAG